MKRKRRIGKRYSITTKGGVGGMSLQRFLANDEVSLVSQMVSADLPSDIVVFATDMYDIDSIAAVAIANIRRKTALSEAMLERIAFLSGIVQQKQVGWCSTPLPTEEHLWHSEEERFLYAFHLSHDKGPEKQLLLLERWIRNGTSFEELSVADTGRRCIIEDLKEKLSFFRRGDGVVYLRARHARIPTRDYFDQVVFFGFTLAPIVVVQSELVPNLLVPVDALTVASYDERYFHFPSFLRDILSIAEYVRIPVNFDIIKPLIDVQTLRNIPPQKFEKVIALAEKYYTPH